MQSWPELPPPKLKKKKKKATWLQLTFQLEDGTADGCVFREAKSGHVPRSGDELRRLVDQLAGGQAQKKWQQQRQHVAVANISAVRYPYPLGPSFDVVYSSIWHM